MALEAEWTDQDQPWWVKVRRAADHIEELDQRVGDFLALDPFEVVYEPTERDYWQRVRLVERVPIPPVLSAVAGDVIHNLRSALDAVVYAMAREDSQGAWRREQETGTAFLVFQTPLEFDNWLEKSGPLYSDRTRRALRSEQPWFWAEMGGLLKKVNHAEEFKWYGLQRLHRASKLDKHRRLLSAKWAYDMPWWGSSGDEPSTRVLARPAADDPPDVQAYQYDPPGGVVNQDVVWDFMLVIDEPGLSDRVDVAKRMRGWHQDVGFAVQTMFANWR